MNELHTSAPAPHPTSSMQPIGLRAPKVGKHTLMNIEQSPYAAVASGWRYTVPATSPQAADIDARPWGEMGIEEQEAAKDGQNLAVQQLMHKQMAEHRQHIKLLEGKVQQALLAQQSSQAQEAKMQAWFEKQQGEMQVAEQAREANIMKIHQLQHDQDQMKLKGKEKEILELKQQQYEVGDNTYEVGLFILMPLFSHFHCCMFLSDISCSFVVIMSRR